MTAPHWQENHIGVRSAAHCSFGALLMRSVDGSSLAVFRILFGTLMALYVVGAFASGTIARQYIGPSFHFTYELFPFLDPWPGRGMCVHFAVMGLAAISLALGLCYRLSAALFFLTYSFVFLLDKAYFNNHYYLVSLLAMLLVVSDGGACWSLDAWRKPPADGRAIPFWNLFLLRAQIVILYFYGGIAKLNMDWLNGDVMRLHLLPRPGLRMIEPLLEPHPPEWLVFFFTYGGLIFDLCIGFALLWRRSRVVACMLVVFFHLTNGLVLYTNIGVFPYIGIASTILFFEPDTPRRLFSRLRKALFSPAEPSDSHRARRLLPPKSRAGLPERAVVGLVAGYLAVQLLVPLRHWLYPGNVNWTERGGRFAWRMKTFAKGAEIVFRTIDLSAGEREITSIGPDTMMEELIPWQIVTMARHPDMILQYADHLKEKLQRQGVQDPAVYADVWVKLNSRLEARLLSPVADLTKVDRNPFREAPWIRPMPPRVDPSFHSTQSTLPERERTRDAGGE